MRVLEIVQASESVIGETRGGSVNEIGALGVLKNLLENIREGNKTKQKNDAPSLSHCPAPCRPAVAHVALPWSGEEVYTQNLSA